MPPIAPPPPPMPPRPARGTLRLPAVRRVPVTAPFAWLALGWRDLWRCGALSLLDGVALAAFGAVMLLLAQDRFWLLAGTFSGFLVVAPVLATSHYALSRALERGETPSFAIIHKTWTRWQYSRYAVHGGYWSLVRFGLLLSLAGTGWVLTSAALITALAPQPIDTPLDFARHVVLARGGFLFELWLIVGGLMAAPLFASSVVSMPLLLDRRVDVLQAVLTSWQAVLTNPATMALWAALIMGLTLIGMGTWMLCLAFILPWLGHASWHAYRALVDASTIAERLPPEGNT